MCTTMPNGVFHSCNDYISQDEMTGHATNGQCDSGSEFQYSCYPELDFASVHFSKFSGGGDCLFGMCARLWNESII